MRQSLTYYLLILVLRLKGIKKSFSSDPVAVQNIRKEDMAQPKGAFFTKHPPRTFQVAETIITELSNGTNTNRLLLFLHGGAFISGPTQHHWDTARAIALHTEYTIWVVNYPKAPEHPITQVSDNIDAVWNHALEYYPATSIALLGDSVGGTLATALLQRLQTHQVSLPSQVVLVSPVMDSSMSNPAIDAIDPIDPMLSKTGILSAKKMCAGNKDLKDPMLSPLYGNFKGFPRTTLFLSQRDIMYPDGKLAAQKMQQAEVPLEVIEGVNMPHIWPLLPVMKEAKIALSQIIRVLNAKDVK